MRVIGTVPRSPFRVRPRPATTSAASSSGAPARSRGRRGPSPACSRPRSRSRSRSPRGVQSERRHRRVAAERLDLGRAEDRAEARALLRGLHLDDPPDPVEGRLVGGVGETEEGGPAVRVEGRCPAGDLAGRVGLDQPGLAQQRVRVQLAVRRLEAVVGDDDDERLAGEPELVSFARSRPSSASAASRAAFASGEPSPEWCWSRSWSMKWTSRSCGLRVSSTCSARSPRSRSLRG